MLGFYGGKGGEGVGSALGRVESGGFARLDSGQVAPGPVGPRWAGLWLFCSPTNFRMRMHAAATYGLQQINTCT